MIRLITGLPGNGKTLRVVWELSKIAEKGERPIYVHGIPDLAIPVNQLEDPEKWYEHEDHALIVIDEAQSIFRPRGTGSNVPPHVARLEKHRHQGIDLWLITQHPMLLDTNVRRLVGEHIHVHRPFGFQRATILKWQEVSNPSSKSHIAQAQKEQWSFPQDAYKLYKSAQVHTHKAQIPWKMVILAIGTLVAAVVAMGYAYYHFSKMANAGKPLTEATKAQPSALGGGLAVVGNSDKKKSPQEDLRDWLDARKPRIEGLPETAPQYDDVMKPQVAPQPSACIKMRDECRCYTHQATLIDMSRNLCEQIVKKGYFDATLARENRSSTSVQGQSNRAPTQQVPTVTLALPDFKETKP